MLFMSKSFTVQKDILLAPLTTFRIGGRARYFIEAAEERQIIEACGFASENDLDLFILGGGSNILVSDRGFEGLVVKIASKGIALSKGDVGTVLVSAQAGEDWDEFVAFCVNENLAGLECLSGIPGLVGGTPIQNVGAYGQEVSETIRAVRVFDRKSREILELSNKECGFEYRKSIFNTTQKDRFIVLSVVYELINGGAPKIVYGDLRRRFGDRTPTLTETREVVREIRQSKGMLVRQGGADARSAGSFFKNPVVTKEKYGEVQSIAEKFGMIEAGETVPYFQMDQDLCKIPAAWLIEKSGFGKGFRKGNAGLSTLHTLALTNRGEATAEDILSLKSEIQNKIKSLFGIGLVPEPNLIGFDN
jgi:UDP-N-acetylmuramate dehydrogenase